MTTLRVFLAGEGSNELGSRFGHPAHQSDKSPGVLHALLRRVAPHGWKVGGARTWSSIRKYRASGPNHNDTHNVLGLVLDTLEAGCHVLVFVRDEDNDASRAAAIQKGIALAPNEFKDAPEIAGGLAVPLLEGWILALRGTRATEALTPKQAVKALVATGITEKDGPAMVEVVDGADLDQLPEDAASLRAWLSEARRVFGAKPSTPSP